MDAVLQHVSGSRRSIKICTREHWIPLQFMLAASFSMLAHTMDFLSWKTWHTICNKEASSCTTPLVFDCSIYLGNPPSNRPNFSSGRSAQTCSLLNLQVWFLCISIHFFLRGCLRREIYHPLVHSLISYSRNFKNFAAVQFFKWFCATGICITLV